jgi:hypothetical protein
MRCFVPGFLLVALSIAPAGVASGQRLIVTAEGHDRAVPPEVSRDSISVEVDKRPAKVQEWELLRGANAALQLYIVIDDGTNTDVASQFGDLKKFIEGQPASTQIGLAYLRNGAVEIVAPMTGDRAALEKKLRIPLGQPGIAASPYLGISDLIRKWPAADARRQVLLISSGIDPFYSPPDPQNPYLLKAIEDAQRAGILVHSIYFPGAGHVGHSYWRLNSGENYLSELGDETGGEAYWQGTGAPVSFAPFPKDLDQRLRNQYLLAVTADETKPGLQPVRVMTSIRGVSLMSASKINFPR